jgi:hypothetical protein
MPASNLDEARAMARSSAAVIETVANELAERAERELSASERAAGRRTYLNADELIREIARLRAI